MENGKGGHPEERQVHILYVHQPFLKQILVDGTSIYLTRDIAAAIERYEKFKFDKMIYVVSSQQDLHLSQFFKILELMKFPWASSLLHINYGLVQGMSTRRGTV